MGKLILRNFVFFSLCFLIFSFHSPARGATITVCDDGCNFTSIQGAISDGGTKDGDTIDISAGTYTQTTITVPKNLTIKGAGADSTIVQAAENPGEAVGSVFSIYAGLTVTIQDMTIRYGKSNQGGGIFFSGSALTLEGCVVTENRVVSDGVGGGICGAGDLTINNCTISSNDIRQLGSRMLGGGIYHSSDNLRSPMTTW